MRLRPSIGNRLTVIAAAAVTVIAVGVGVVAWFALRETLIQQADRELRAMSHGPIENITPEGAYRVPSTPFDTPNRVRIQVRNDIGTPPPPVGVEALPWSATDQKVADGTLKSASYTTEAGDERFRVLTVKGRQGQTIQLARSLAGADATLQSFGLLMALLVVAAASLAAFAGRLVARAGLRPVSRLTAAATRIAETRDLSQHIAVAGHDEVAQLGQAFNHMLIRLDTARQQQRELIEDAAHELRTPMASLRTNVELLIHAGGLLGDDDRTALLADLERQSSELSELVTSLVALARSRNTDEPSSQIELSELAAEAIGLAQTHFPQATFTLHAPEPVTIAGQPSALLRALVNLLDNAAKFGSAGQTVEVQLAVEDGLAKLSVADRCPTIPADEREKIFHRFHRTETARAVPGSGLGLAIVHQTVTAHGGRANALARPGGGNVFQLSLPLILTPQELADAA
ncbi:two-component sensor histidine kinase [Rhizocola hellebori]|uniref:histidine kinase n=1 Tax=Rhizocola hellebori TaxID=1392758 RepID=A0A8J3Q9Y7_9ACTN|nr:HAMP domain-containing sensor histidine kinase [Rhizocola hellebori]GIH06154.1 two-component sensor histidine kinase [Rhizocola hellebori]